MDYAAHGLWSYAIFRKIEKPHYAVMFGILPDTMSWAIFLIYRFVVDGFRLGPPQAALLPAWMDTLYGFSHSLIVFAVAWILIFIIWRRVPVYVYAWVIHVFIDFPTHSADFLPTPFLWPISDYKFPGISWSTPWFMIANYALLLSIFVYILYERRRQRRLLQK